MNSAPTRPILSALDSREVESIGPRPLSGHGFEEREEMAHAYSSPGSHGSSHSSSHSESAHGHDDMEEHASDDDMGAEAEEMDDDLDDEDDGDE